MRVLSLFDGIGCGQVALNSLGIYPEVCYASEIDGYALRVSKRHFPNTIHLGDISTVKAHDVGDIAMPILQQVI